MQQPANPRDPGGTPIDFAHLAEQTGGDDALQVELLALFSRQAREILDRVAAAAGSTSGGERTLLFHTLSGSARAVGAWRVAADAQQLEDEARAGAEASGLDALQHSVAEACATIAPR